MVSRKTQFIFTGNQWKVVQRRSTINCRQLNGLSVINSTILLRIQLIFDRNLHVKGGHRRLLMLDWPAHMRFMRIEEAKNQMKRVGTPICSIRMNFIYVFINKFNFLRMNIVKWEAFNFGQEETCCEIIFFFWQENGVTPSFHGIIRSCNNRNATRIQTTNARWRQMWIRKCVLALAKW